MRADDRAPAGGTDRGQEDHHTAAPVRQHHTGRPCSKCGRNPVMGDEDPLCVLCFLEAHEAAEEGHRITVVRGLVPPTLADLLGRVETFVGRFVSFQNRHQRIAVALWVPHVYAIAGAPAAAYLRIKSAAEESGKTTLLEVLELLLGPRGINAVSITPASVFRIRDKIGPVALLLDEIDQTLRNRQDDGARDLLALVNAGYRRSATVYRTVGRDHEPRGFQAFGPAAIAGLGHLHPTTESRCIPIVLERKVRGSGERWLRHLVEEEGKALAEQLSGWATEEVIAHLRAAAPAVPQELRDRHVETWWALWAIADLAGGEWPQLAREAAEALHLGADAADTMTAGVLLLAHVRAAFDEAGQDRLATADLLHRLVEKEEGPWGKWWGAEVERAESPRAAATDLARHLRAFGPRPRVVRTADGRTPRGYLRDDFEEAWERYLPPVGRGDATDATHATSLASTVASVASVAEGDPNGENGWHTEWRGIVRAAVSVNDGNLFLAARQLNEAKIPDGEGKPWTAAKLERFTAGAAS